jgi:hypothetical protein
MNKSTMVVAVLSMFCSTAPHALAASASALTPGMYEYTMKMSMPGMPMNMPAQTSQRCLTSKDVDSNKAIEMPTERNSDCQIKDMANSGAQFSYKISCTKPQKMDGSAKGSVTATSLSMEMTMVMPEAPGPMTQSITARRIGDCK